MPEGSKEYSNAYALATTASSPKLGAAKNFVTESEDGEPDPGNANYRNIQEQFVGNYSKIKDAQKHSVNNDFMEIILVRKVVDTLLLFFGRIMEKKPLMCLRTGLILPFIKSRSVN